METDLNFWLQLFTVAFCIGLGGRYGGVGLGAAGGLGVCILVLFFGLKPSSPPVSTILIIVAVIACTSILQGAGGLDWMVKIAERMLRRWPKAITFVAAFCLFLLRDLCGDGLRGFCGLPGGGRSGHSGPRASRASDCGLGHLCGHCRGGFADERRNCSAGGVAFRPTTCRFLTS